MASLLRHLVEEEEKSIREMERWHKDIVKLQSLVNKGNWADDTDSKSFALHIADRMCEDLQQRIQEHKSHLTTVDHNPAVRLRYRELERWYKDMVKLQSLVNKGNWSDDTDSKSFALHIADRMCEDLQQRLQERKSHLVSDSDAQGIRANKRQQLDEQRMAGSKRAIHKTDKDSKKKKKLEDRNGEIMKQIIVPKERANDDGFKWKKYGSKTIRNEIYPRDYYKCASKGCLGKRTVQAVDTEKVRIVYYKVHNCGAQLSFVMQQQLLQQQKEGFGSDQNAGLVNEAQTEQQQSPIIPQEMPEDIMICCQPNGGVLSSRSQLQQHDQWLQLLPQITDNDEIGSGLYNTGLILDLQQQSPPPVDQSIRMFQSQSLDLSEWLMER